MITASSSHDAFRLIVVGFLPHALILRGALFSLVPEHLRGLSGWPYDLSGRDSAGNVAVDQLLAGLIRLGVKAQGIDAVGRQQDLMISVGRRACLGPGSTKTQIEQKLSSLFVCRWEAFRSGSGCSLQRNLCVPPKGRSTLNMQRCRFDDRYRTLRFCDAAHCRGFLCPYAPQHLRGKLLQPKHSQIRLRDAGGCFQDTSV